MKFINYLKSIAGVEIYPMISLFIFLIFFIALAIYAIKADKEHINELKNIPLEKENH
jgi:transcriptional antiterminator